MITNILEINDYIVLIEQSNESKTTTEKCDLDDQVIGFSFYASGDVQLSVNFNNKQTISTNETGIAYSFYGNKKVVFSHKISPKKPLQSVSIFLTKKNFHKLPAAEQAIYTDYLDLLVNPTADYVEGPYFYMTPEMQSAVLKIFNSNYTGILRKLFLQSQITELLTHFFALLATEPKQTINSIDKEKLYNAKEIITNNIASPPSLSELSKLIGLNSNKLKKNFKELFGVPVFKYLQNERLTKAHQLLKSGDMNIQEVSWHVGYESVSSFSNAFLKKFGVRPSDIHK